LGCKAMKEKKLPNRTNIRRRAVILLALLVILALVLGQMVFASNEGGPIRSAHKVKAGDKSFCFFVANNVVLTQSELASLDDEALVMEIMKRTGLFIKEASCNDPDHLLISVDEWTAAGNTLGISEDDIASLRQAAPSEGKSAKFHMDIQFTLKPEEKEKPAEEPEEGEGPEEDPAVDPSDDPADDQDGDVSGNPEEAVTEDTSDGQEDPSEDDPIVDPGDDQEGDVSGNPEELEIYTTYKLTSPELLFIVIVADEDAAVTEDECEAVEPALPEEPEIPEIPEMEIPDISEPTEMLPEYRKIDMVDKSGAPLTPVLEDGEPVELVWIEPNNTIDPEKAKNWIEAFPGGWIGLGGMIAALAAIGIGVFVTMRKREED